jgi:hypothetical protein
MAPITGVLPVETKNLFATLQTPADIAGAVDSVNAKMALDCKI